ncbi:hypothetical protein pW2_165 [Bacillus phage pW2]|uniref:Uncharacterized protein n=1 Tax=Bacillus phage pW2 TaxID=2500559 RepID=A0A3Q9R7M6_9CAUD|nr:hypothetical protein PQE69_gp129 [Bacillus phage pW2]AZU98989.1 hypothetical protein pW2_165 [Bacillus phage pW2]
MITFEEAVILLEADMEVTLECDGYDYEIAPADGFVGGDGMEGWISVALGNVVYDDAERVLKESIKFLSEDGAEVGIVA